MTVCISLRALPGMTHDKRHGQSLLYALWVAFARHALHITWQVVIRLERATSCLQCVIPENGTVLVDKKGRY